MSTTVADHRDVSTPADLRSARAKLVYVYLATCGAATADDLRDALDVDKGSILSITATLRERGHVRWTDGKYELA